MCVRHRAQPREDHHPALWVAVRGPRPSSPPHPRLVLQSSPTWPRTPPGPPPRANVISLKHGFDCVRVTGCVKVSSGFYSTDSSPHRSSPAPQVLPQKHSVRPQAFSVRPRPHPEECEGSMAETEGTAHSRRAGNVAPLLPGHSTAMKGGE